MPEPVAEAGTRARAGDDGRTGADPRPRRPGYAGLSCVNGRLLLPARIGMPLSRARQAEYLLDAGDRPGSVHERSRIAAHIVEHATRLKTPRRRRKAALTRSAVTSALSTSVTPGPTARAIASRSSG